MGTAFIGKGKMRIARYDSGASFALRKFRDIENTSEATLSFTENEQTLPDYQDASGGTDASYKRIETVTLAISPRHYTPENLADAVWGSTTAVAATPITGEASVCRLGAFVPTAKLIDMTVAPVVKKGVDTVDAADYTVHPSGIEWKASVTTVGLTDEDAVTIDYTPKVSVDIEALISTAPEVSVWFEGVNAVDGKYTVLHAFKGKIGVAQGIGLIGDDFGTLALTITIERDETIVASGKSKFFKLLAES